MSSDALYIQRLRPTTKLIEQSFTRPADTATYAVGDAVNNSTSSPTIMTFANAVRQNAGGGVIQNVLLVMSTAATLVGDFDLMLFESSITMNNDNAAFSPRDADAKKCIAVIPLRGAVDASKLGANVVYDTGPISRSFKAAAGTKSVFGVLVARNAYVPANAEEFTVRLLVLQD
jgi:hypothetical protein